MLFRLTIAALAAALVVTPALARCAEGETKLLLGLVEPQENSPLQRGSSILKERIDRNLQGRFCLELVRDSGRFTSSAAIPELQEQDVQLALVDLADLGRFVPLAQVYRLPFAFRHERAQQAFQTAILPNFNERLSRNGATALAFLQRPAVHLGARKPLFEPSHMAGAKVRVVGAANTARARLRPLDAVPQAPSDAGVVEDLKAGRVDVVEGRWDELQKLAADKQITHVLEAHQLADGYVLLASSNWWGELSEAFKRELTLLIAEAVQQANFRAANAERNNRRRALEAGLDVRILTDGQRLRWTQRLADLWGDFRASNPPVVVKALEDANRDF
ncbi:MAG: TRAP transporter substrate-binding protein DctP [Pseudomonadota bacterium]